MKEKPITTLFMLESLDGKISSGNTGRVMAKIGVNERTKYHDKIDCRFIIIDNKPHLNEKGIDYICHWVNKLILVTTNKNHVAYSLREKYDNLDILFYNDLDLKTLLTDMGKKYGAKAITIQSGGTLNGKFLRDNLIDYVNIVIAPLLVGGKDTSTLIDGESIISSKELGKLKALKLIECKQLDDSYIQLKYKVIK